MVAIIKTGYSIRRILIYNEKKVSEGVARLIGAVGYPIDAADLTFSAKLNRLTRQAELNPNVKRNSVHISLNFDPSEKLSAEKLNEIARTYMDKIGFNGMPYLIYEHFDAGHPHIHLVSLKVRADGSRIDTQNIGRNQSEKARKEIEISFGLVKAELSTNKEAYQIKPVSAELVQYGKGPTKRAVAKVLNAVLTTYKYTSVPELNAVLSEYNVYADQGSEDSRILKNEGLTYRVLDKNGNVIGVPLKASSFYDKPTLQFLKKRFPANKATRNPDKKRIRNAVDFLLLKADNLDVLVSGLQKQGINAKVQRSAEGKVYGITYVDHVTKSVFKGSDLGEKTYSAHGVLRRCAENKAVSDKDTLSTSKTAVHASESKLSAFIQIAGNSAGELIHNSGEDADFLPFELKSTKKKRKKRSQSSNNL